MLWLDSDDSDNDDADDAAVGRAAWSHVASDLSLPCGCLTK